MSHPRSQARSPASADPGWMAETLRTDFIRWLCLIRPQARWPLLRGATCDLDQLQLSLLKMKWPR